MMSASMPASVCNGISYTIKIPLDQTTELVVEKQLSSDVCATNKVELSKIKKKWFYLSWVEPVIDQSKQQVSENTCKFKTRINYSRADSSQVK